jgi:hypothetical protein
MALPWFRLYSEIQDDPKVQMLPENMRWRFIALLCCRCKEETLTDPTVAFLLRLSAAETQETKSLFIANGFIDPDWKILKWEERQKPFDSSKKRTQQYRRRLVTRHSDGIVTGGDDIDIDKDIEEEALAERRYF